MVKILNKRGNAVVAVVIIVLIPILLVVGTVVYGLKKQAEKQDQSETTK